MPARRDGCAPHGSRASAIECCSCSAWRRGPSRRAAARLQRSARPAPHSASTSLLRSLTLDRGTRATPEAATVRVHVCGDCNHRRLVLALAALLYAGVFSPSSSSRARASGSGTSSTSRSASSRSSPTSSLGAARGRLRGAALYVAARLSRARRALGAGRHRRDRDPRSSPSRSSARSWASTRAATASSSTGCATSPAATSSPAAATRAPSTTSSRERCAAGRAVRAGARRRRRPERASTRCTATPPATPRSSGSARCCAQHAEPGDVIARIGGDEFALLTHLPADQIAALQARTNRTLSAENLSVDVRRHLLPRRRTDGDRALPQGRRPPVRREARRRNRATVVALRPDAGSGKRFAGATEIPGAAAARATRRPRGRGDP